MGLLCYCENYCPEIDKFNGTCEVSENAYCFSAVELVFDEHLEKFKEYRTFGCLDMHETGLMQCRSYLTKHAMPKNISCCREFDMCNENVFPKLIYDEESLHSAATYGVQFVHLIISIIVVFFVIALASLLWYLYKQKLHFQFLYRKDSQNYACDENLSNELKSLSDNFDHFSGSGSGLARLVQLTIGKQIHMIRSIGKGRYGEVLLGKWRGERVAVKVFSTTDEASWLREKEIYQTVLLRHENILGFIASDIRGMSSYTQMLLITDYHDLGSLYDYLKFYTLDQLSMFKLSYSLASGLSHLHTEIFGTKGKPAIAHRDLKSKNILVKNNGECCIADFGLAVKYSSCIFPEIFSQSEEMDIGNNPKVGTRRYMAPEVLDGRINISAFESLKRADIYSVSLVLWEIFRRYEMSSSEKHIEACEYELPYFEYVTADPSIEDMYEVVCIKKLRPQKPAHWNNDPVMMELKKVLRECWQHNPAERLTALRVKYTIGKIRSAALNEIKLGIV